MGAFFKDIKHRIKYGDIFDMLDAEGEDEFERNNKETRERTFENTSSNHGWYKDGTDGKSYRKKDMDGDHIIPHSQGGDNSRRNLQATSSHNNRSKQDSMENTTYDFTRRQAEIDELNCQDAEWLDQREQEIKERAKEIQRQEKIR